MNFHIYIKSKGGNTTNNLMSQLCSFYEQGRPPRRIRERPTLGQQGPGAAKALFDIWGIRQKRVYLGIYLRNCINIWGKRFN